MWMASLLSLLVYSSSSLLILIPTECNAAAIDVINSTQSLKDNDTLVSTKDKTFVLGFFSPGSSKNRYVGIWYNSSIVRDQRVVWVANREAPIPPTAKATLVINSTGSLVLFLNDDPNNHIWSSNSWNTAGLVNPAAKLLDTGNLVVVRNGNDNPKRPENRVWESFDYLTDTAVGEVKLGKDNSRGIEWYLSSWKSADDPAPGDYTFQLDPTGYPQILLKHGSVVEFSSGPLTYYRLNRQNSKDLGDIADDAFPGDSYYTVPFLFNDTEMSLEYESRSKIQPWRLTLNWSCGCLQFWKWEDRDNYWSSGDTFPKHKDGCDYHSHCGANSNCTIIGNQPAKCVCLPKFEPKDPEEWGMSNWSNGCVRSKTPSDCKTDVFLISAVTLPDSQNTWFDNNMSFEECEQQCLTNCSCVAYTHLNITTNGAKTGCLHWLNHLFDIKSGDIELFIRTSNSSSSSGVNVVIIILLAGIVLAAAGIIMRLYVRRRNTSLRLQMRQEELLERETERSNPLSERQNQDLELPVFGLLTLANATNSFSINNKLGEGGFGPVYKGILDDGQEIAVKCLSRASMQGLDEFKNEVICISKLQHRNLVKLLGCCIQEGETMLVYEYMPNKSLDCYIFDENLSKVLDWRKRINIINGIARGLLYLHRDSRLRIIHRDLKAGNILLDFDMNPKISDFGIARTFGGNETEASTERVVGTYGYMAPEYAVDGLFSGKSDVYSFGVLVLEIVSGKKNRGFVHEDHHHNLVGHAWMLYQQGRSLELMDAALVDTCNLSEVSQSIQVALLCVQQSPEDRPSMSSVVFMLSSDAGGLPQPKQPGFFTERSIFGTDFSSSTKPQSSSGEVTFTQLREGR